MSFMDISESSNKNSDIAPRPWMRDHIIRWCAMDHSVPILANFEALTEMLAAKDLEGLLQIDRKTIYVCTVRTHTVRTDRIECPLLQTPGPALAGRTQLPAPTGERLRLSASGTLAQVLRSSSHARDVVQPLLLCGSWVGTKPELRSHVRQYATGQSTRARKLQRRFLRVQGLQVQRNAEPAVPRRSIQPLQPSAIWNSGQYRRRCRILRTDHELRPGAGTSTYAQADVLEWAVDSQAGITKDKLHECATKYWTAS